MFQATTPPSATPPLGPVAFPHRASALELPQATLSHHLQDSTHIASNVATVAVRHKWLRLEASSFYGTEPNENRWNIDWGPMNSYSARVSIFPTSNWMAQFSAGRLTDPERQSHQPGRKNIGGDVVRMTSSVHYTRPMGFGNSWSTSFIWGRNHSVRNQTNANSYLVETLYPVSAKNFLTGRVEVVDKDELAVLHGTLSRQSLHRRVHTRHRDLPKHPNRHRCEPQRLCDSIGSPAVLWTTPLGREHLPPPPHQLQTLMKRLAWILLLIVTCAASALLAVRVTGGFTARRTASSVEIWIARAVRSITTPSETKQRKNPAESNNQTIAAGLAHWADHCAGCHANNGSGQTSMGQGMFPPAPDMRLPATQQMTDGELFSIIENGIPWTGMAAFGHPNKDATDSWNLVHFIRHLPNLTFEERREMERLNPKGPDQIEEERQQQEFLKGETQ